MKWPSSSQSNKSESFHYTYLLWNPVGPASKLPDRLALMQEPAMAWWLAESRSLQQSSRITPTRSRWLPLALRLFVIPSDISPMLGPMLGLIAWCPSVSTTLLVSPAADTTHWYQLTSNYASHLVCDFDIQQHRVEHFYVCVFLKKFLWHFLYIFIHPTFLELETHSAQCGICA